MVWRFARLPRAACAELSSPSDVSPVALRCALALGFQLRGLQGPSPIETGIAAFDGTAMGIPKVAEFCEYPAL
jgi:hypothetical protein